MAKTYKSVSEMVKNLAGDKAFAENFEKEAANRILANALFNLRCSNGVTQKEMAERIGCTQSRISKLESSGADSIKVSDLVDYAKALDLCVTVTFHPEMNAVEAVKFHAFEIKKHLEHLATLAHKDDGIFEGVSRFFSEAVHNLVTIVQMSAKKLPKKATEKRPILEVASPAETTENRECAQNKEDTCLAR